MTGMASTPNNSRHSYVIDSSYRLVHLDETCRRRFPGAEKGDLCYRALRNRERPCPDCTWKPSTGQELVQTVLYSQVRNCWFDTVCIETDWPEHGRCILFSAQPIDNNSKDLFRSMTENATYDELFELNLGTNHYQILYHAADIFITPPLSGELDTMIDEAASASIHPDDRARFLTFWRLDTLIDHLERSGGSLSTRFRKKCVDGTWAMAGITAVLVRRGTANEPVVMVFITKEVDQPSEDVTSDFSPGGYLPSIDPLTGLYNNGTFMRKADDLIAQCGDDRFEFLYIDVENFKVYNEWYGRDAGDRLLVNISLHLRKAALQHRGLIGYLGADDFVAVLPLGTTESGFVEDVLRTAVAASGETIGFIPAIGACIIDPSVPIGTTCDHAMTAALSIKGNYRQRIAWYRADMMQRLEEDPRILIEVQRGLDNREFTIHWQPQCNTRTGKIVGLEALVRWQHPERGLVYPPEFIPLLERNGFIANLDLYVWEEVCRTIRSWIDRGGKPIPVSVNISRDDLYAIDVVQTIVDLVDRYDLDRSVLELEITETIYAEDERIIEAVSTFKDLGFTVLIDDFGSGYSSLNMLRELQADIIKIDMKFLDADTDSLNRSENILESILSMTRLMEISVIAEGAETEEQVEFLRDIGCDFAQGYYFYKPMPTEDLEKILAQKDTVDYRGIDFKQVELMEIHDLFRNDVASRTIIDNIVGAMAVYAVHDQMIEVLQVNKLYYRAMGCDPTELRENRTRILDYFHPEDVEHVFGLFDYAEKHTVSGALGTYRRYRFNGELMWLRVKLFFLRDEGDRKLFYAALLDISYEKQQEDTLRLSQERLDEVLGLHLPTRGIDDITSENRMIAAQVFTRSVPGGLIGGYCEEGFPLFFANNELIHMLGYGSYGEFTEAIGGLTINTIHPDDIARVVEDIGPEFYEGLEYRTQYRMPHKDGTWFWTADRGRIVRTDSGRLAFTSVCIDITETVIMQQELEYEDRILKSVIGQADLNVWLYSLESQRISFMSMTEASMVSRLLPPELLPQDGGAFVVELDTLLASSRLLIESKEALGELFSDIRAGVDAECELLVRFMDGYLRWIKVSSEVLLDGQGNPVRAIGYLEDIDDAKRHELDLESRADTDPLTGLANRASGTRLIEQAIKETIASDRTAALVVLDLDDFKCINDRFGHLAGDKALVESAHTLRSLFRADDIVCRWGGDEFVVFCHNITEHDARNVARTICETRWQVIMRNTESITVSVSAGLAMVPACGARIAELFEHADTALYAAKAQGKACSVSYVDCTEAV